MKNSSGSVVLFTLMILSVILILTQQLMRTVFVGSHFTRTMVEREHAEMLALGGVNIAIAQLTIDSRDEDEKKGESKSQSKEEGKESQDDRAIKKMLARVLPHLNRWQEFKLQEKIDGIDGQVSVCITCEHGKININEAFDFKKMEFKKEYEALLKGLELHGKMQPGEMLTKITEFLKKRKKKLDDVSELLQVPGLEVLDIFYQPPVKPAQGKKSHANSELALQDIFTTWSFDDKIDLLWLSDALCAIFGVRRPHADDAQFNKERFKIFVKDFKKNMAQDWDSHWKVLENIYEQKPKVLPEIKNIFTKEFGPKVFSVLSCGKIGHVQQQVLAVIAEEKVQEKSTGKQQENPQKEKSQNETKETKAGPKKVFKILRVYWL